MRSRGLEAGLAWLDAFEVHLCLPCNHMARIRPVSSYFRLVSRLGDGPLWYALLAALPLVLGQAALLPTVHMAATALAGVAIYKGIKRAMLRERPFASHVDVQAWVEPLDRYSFPSGHTLHAALFLTMLAHYFPVIALIILPFGLSVAASRVILGLHYPSDVVIGALMGWTLACLSLAVLQV